jgi:hypothetical protein
LAAFSVRAEPSDGSVKKDREGCLKIMKTELIPVVRSGEGQLAGGQVVPAVNKSIEQVNAKILKDKKECELILKKLKKN